MRLICGAVMLMLAAGAAHAEAPECKKNARVIAQSTGLTVSGKTDLLKGVAYTVPQAQGSGKDDTEQVRRDFVAIRALGFNAVRGYEPFSPTVLQLATGSGLWVIQALVHLSDETNFDSEDELRELITEAQQIVLRGRCHQAVVMWGLWNDAPFNWGTSGGNVVERFGTHVVHRFLRRLRDSIKLTDPSRPLTAAHVLNAKHAEVGMDLLDVIGINAYIGVFDWSSQRYSDSLAEATIARLKAISKKHRKPLWISETGVASIAGADSGSVVIPRQIQLVEKAGFAGFSIFQWRDDPAKANPGAEISRDIEANWGLLTREGGPKPSLSKVSEILRDKAGADKFALRPDPWSSGPLSSALSKGYDLMRLNKFVNAKEPRSGFRIRSKGRSHGYITTSAQANGQPTGLSVHYVPEDYGAWLIFGKILENPFQFPPGVLEEAKVRNLQVGHTRLDR